MEGTILISIPQLTCTQFSEVLCSLRSDLIVKSEHNSTYWGLINCDVKVYVRILWYSSAHVQFIIIIEFSDQLINLHSYELNLFRLSSERLEQFAYNFLRKDLNTFIIIPKNTSHKKIKQKKMSYSRLQIQNIIARNKKRNNAQKSPSPPLSPKSIAVNRSNSPKDMAIRYQELCAKYKTLLEDVKDKNHKFQLQEVELERLKSEKQRDQKQLYRLRSIIGFIKKQDKGTQVNMDMQSTGSWSTKMQKSTAIEYQNDIQWNTPVKKTQPFKINRKKSPTSKQFATSTTLIGNKNTYKTHTHELYDNFDSEHSRINTESIYSPKNSNKEVNTILNARQSRQVQSRYNKLSNSPYSRLRFSRNM